MARGQEQLDLFAKKRGKRRAKPGPKPHPERLGFVPHRVRPAHDWRHPVHVSIRRVRLAPSFRSQSVHAAIVEQLAAVKRRGVRVLHYSIQDNHLHLMIEGQDRAHLARHMKLLFSRVAFAVNRVARRHGSLFRDRHHRHELATPSETRRALVYILFNGRKHAIENGGVSTSVFERLDECSSSLWFRDWDPEAQPSPTLLAKARAAQANEPPTSAGETWLARVGWQKAGGLIRFHESPSTRL